MNSKIASALIFVLTALMILASVLIISEYLYSYEQELLFIGILFVIVTAFMLLFIIFDIIIGRKVYKLQKGKIIVSRKGKVLYEFSNKDITEPTLTRDASSGKSEFLTFRYNGKKHYVYIKEGKEIALKQFIQGINVKTRDNTLEYLLLFILEAFSI